MANRNSWNRGNIPYANPYAAMNVMGQMGADRGRSAYGGMPMYGGGGYREDRRPDAYRGPQKSLMDRPPINRKRSRSPGRSSHGFNQRPTPPRRANDQPSYHSRYEVVVPNHVFQDKEASVPDLKRRFNKMYVPSDFFHVDYRWQESFLTSQPYRLGNPCEFHVFHKDVDNPFEASDKDVKDLLDPEDASYVYSAKVMLLSSSDLATFYQNTIRTAEEDPHAAANKSAWLKQLHFVVGTRGKNEVMAIGGPWSPSLDGENPAEDPQVLINTAIRTCRAQTGLDLSPCTRWYKFLELHYFRPAERSVSTRRNVAPPEGDVQNGSEPDAPALETRVETVVMFLPDVYNCMPTPEHWQEMCAAYKELLAAKLAPPSPPPPAETAEGNGDTTATDMEASTEQHPAIEELEVAGTEQVAADALVPTHYSKLDPSNMKVAELRTELEARNLDSKGLKSQLIAKLEAVLKEEETKETDAAVADVKCEEVPAAAVPEPTPAPAVLSEKEQRRLERLYRVDEEKPVIVIHPSRVARSGKFDCEKLSLNTLLDYRLDDQKEHTFEVSLFVEQFKDMVLRDSAFNIYKAIVVAPENAAATQDSSADKHKDEDDATKRRRLDDSAEEKMKSGNKEKRTVDANLLFSFTVFDSGFANYIKTVDLEGILACLGLNLSRSQSRKLVQKVAGTKDMFYYRSLTDKDADEQTLANLNAVLDDVDYLEELAMGNRVFLGDGQRDSPSSIIVCSADSSRILSRLDQHEQVRATVQEKFSEKCAELLSVREVLNASRDCESEARHACKQLRDELFHDREKLKEQRLLNRTYNRLLVMTNEQVTRATSEIRRQFDKEDADKKTDSGKVKPDGDNGDAKPTEKSENVTVLDSA